jgi:hypothetical protein
MKDASPTKKFIVCFNMVRPGGDSGSIPVNGGPTTVTEGSIPSRFILKSG